ncbi:hypothetical protein J3D43_001822 [Paenibacillus xylanexedens]|uniref:hypothetical protein n=1 Tax=Paenibacillus xylanexedens TaxID=528191 RepID=UPI00209D05EC|nr:hypothetical protein [Paenibacillus xylanexedens]MCP1423306.1 hypothetical protein [Paenibacillus xylanexedens]
MPMRFLQYGLIIVPAVLYLLMLPLENEAVYTLYIIIALGLSVWKDFNRSSTQQWLLLLAEILWSCWLIASYGTFMFFLSLSVLYVYIYRLVGSRRWLMFAIQLVANNVALHWHYSAPQAPQPGLTTLNTTATTLLSTESTAMVLGNLLLLITAALSWQGSRTGAAADNWNKSMTSSAANITSYKKRVRSCCYLQSNLKEWLRQRNVPVSPDSFMTISGID